MFTVKNTAILLYRFIKRYKLTFVLTTKENSMRIEQVILIINKKQF
ncbi:hypothetical protein Pryu01_01794 [Paraliobacillus ryukyuensis]|uniref:Uncharacterized protein n=1 Tax=Paraliobacillus ryukyuensis TaxID=200904 RepID=A0A366E7G8_9BACI|nr:hypothetical protein [Paraliobacillus ryukyuensis]RBO98311.1 hypothetical protein DES48_105162 [Paraliobacillus ryukyuensis]